MRRCGWWGGASSPAAATFHPPPLPLRRACPSRRLPPTQRSEWPYEKPAAEVKRRKPKGHKHDREKPLRCAAVPRLRGCRCVAARLPSCAAAPAHRCLPPLPPCREAEVAKKLAEADKRIAAYRAAQHAPMREASLMDRLLLSPKQIRQKAKGG